MSAAEKKRCHELLEAVGQALWVDDEALIDPVTALSGSGPAYVFLLVEAMAAAGAKLGLTPEMAMQLARATVAGSGELLRQSSEPASQLRVNVTSPGGTTAEALKVLMAADGIQPVFDKALAAASRRSKELAGMTMRQPTPSSTPSSRLIAEKGYRRGDVARRGARRPVWAWPISIASIPTRWRWWRPSWRGSMPRCWPVRRARSIPRRPRATGCST